MSGIEVAQFTLAHGPAIFRAKEHRPRQPIEYDCAVCAGSRKGWTLLDSFSAQAIVQVWDALDGASKEKYERLSIHGMVQIAFTFGSYGAKEGHSG